MLWIVAVKQGWYFFYISKAFDKVWHNGPIFKLHAAGIDGKVLSSLRDYLSNRTQKVVLPGGSSKSLPVRAGVPQGSVLGPLMFLVYINDIVDNLESVINLFADDTSLSIEIDTPNISGVFLQSDIEKINNWADRWLVKFNPSKSKSLLISRKRVKPDHPVLTMSNIAILSVQFHKHLGICLSCVGSWDQQIQSIVEKAWKRIGILRRLNFLLIAFLCRLCTFHLFLNMETPFGTICMDTIRKNSIRFKTRQQG